MAEKLSWSELRRILASRAGVSEKEANAFLNAFTEQIVEALKTDKQVKINGLGIFRLQAVAPRKSVNVATGETIIIDGYNKIAFVPEAGVKELVERGGTVSVPASEKAEEYPVDPLKKLGEQADEIVGILGELGQSPEEKAEEPVKEPEPEPIVVPEPVKEPEPEPVKESEPAKKPEKEYHFVRDTLICVVVLLLLLLVCYFFLRSQLGGWIDSLLQNDPAPTEQVVAVQDTTAASPTVQEDTVAEEILTEEQVLAEFLECSEETENQAAPEETIYEELITIEPMHEASRLAWMAKRYYGDKAYWPYLYDANKDHISDPGHIEVGTPIRVPKLTAAQRDTTSNSFKQLRRKAEEACRTK